MIAALISRRAAVLVFALAVTVLLGGSALSLRIDPGVESMLPSGGDDLARLRRFNARFGSDEVILLAVHADPLFTAGRLRTLEDLTRKASRLPHVARVLSPTNVRDVEGDELGPYPVVPYEQFREGEIAPAELGRRLAAHPIYGGLLVSRDARTAALLIDVTRTEGDAAYREDLVRQVRELAARAGSDLETHVAGIPVEKADVAALVARDQRIFVPIIFILLAGATAFLYRHPTGVVVPLSVVAVSLLWTLGLYAGSGRALNPVTSLMTPVVLVVSVAGTVHLLNRHLAGRAAGLDRAASLERAVTGCWAPCLNAALTTAIGFGSLSFLPIPAIRDFGVFTSTGVMVAYLLTVTLAPALIATLPDFSPRADRSFRPGAMESALKGAIRMITRHPVPTAAAAAVVLGLSALGVVRIRVETDLIRSLKESSPLYRDTIFIDRHLTGVNSLEILVPGIGPDDPDEMRKVERFENEVRGRPGIRKVTGLPDLLSRVNRAFHAGDDAFEKLPDGPEAADDLDDSLALLKREAPEELARFVSTDGKALRVAGRAAALDTASSQALFAEIQEAAGRAGLPPVELTGNFVVLSDMSTTLVRNQARGIGVALALILAALAIQFRSARLGLLSVIPNGAPVLMVYGLMGWAGIALSVPTATIACISLGMTVDNTIHLLARFRRAFGESRDYGAALAAMMDESGRAVVYSTIIVAVGFGVGIFSSFTPSIHFSILTGAALLLGLLSQTVLLPLSLILLRPLGGRGRASMARKSRAALALAILPALSAPASPARAAGPRAELVLKDQHGHDDGPSRHRGRIVLLVYGEPASLRRMKAWEVRLLEKAGEGPDVLRAVDARSLRGRKTEAEVEERLRRNVPGDIAVLVDWNGDLARVYDLGEAEVSATFLDPRGKTCGTIRGPANREAVDRALELLARIRKKGGCP